jgi:hypothetical protein
MHVLAHQGALGDWVLTWPILRGLGRLGPTLAVAPRSKAELAAALIGGAVAAGIESPPWTRLYAPDAPAAVSADPQFGPDDILISFVAGPADPWTANLRALAPNSRRFLVDPRPPADWTGHVTAWYASELARQGLTLPPVAIPLRRRPQGPVVIHPGSGGRDKCWPRQRFLEVALALRRRGRPVRLLLGEVEMERWPAAEVQDLIGRHGASALTDLASLHAELAPAAVFLGNDSGPTHLAAQMGLPTLALFGPTDPQRWRPIGPAVTVLAPPRPGPMTWLEPPAVLAALDPPSGNHAP